MYNEKMEKILIELKKSIDFIAEKQKVNFEKINERFDEHERKHAEDFARINERFDKHEEKQRQDFARLEHVMYDRTEALFDARQISLEKDEDLYSKIKSIDKILDKHHYRILKLESKAN